MAMLQHSAIEEGIYPIQRSLRFRSSASAYLSRTPATTGNTNVFTYSAWIKRGIFGLSHGLIGGWNNANNGTNITFDVGDTISFNNTVSGIAYGVKTAAVFRDPSAWYHIVVKVDLTQATAANRVLIYVNGVQQTVSASPTYPAQNQGTYVNYSVNSMQISAYNTSYFFDGYLAELNWIDGQALTPSSFGQTDAVTGVWTPKKYTGTYGTNGFYLDFKDNSTTTALASDKSGNGNNWTANNISLTAGATYDSMTDVPTLTSATAANYCVLNPLNGDTNTAYSIYGGNLYCFHGTDGSYTHAVTGTMSVNSGKWYWEVSGSYYVGVTAFTEKPLNDNYYNSTLSYSYVFNGNKSQGATATAYGATYNTTTDIIGVALDMSAGTVTFYKNGVSQGTAYTGLSGYFTPFSLGWSSLTSIYNFGQRPFSYTPPTGFVALNTFNLPDPTIKKPNQYMDATLYTGNGGTINVTNTAEFQPDLIWTKGRSNGGTNHLLTDSSRGNGVSLMSNTTGADGTRGCTILSNGFSYTYPNEGGDGNYSGWTYVGWQWKKGATPGFDIVTYTGTGVARTVSHSLGVAPKMVIVKNRSAVGDWCVWHQGVYNTYGSQAIVFVNSTDAATNQPTVFNSTAPTSSVFSVGTNGATNGSGNNLVAYLFAEIAGFSKFGSYTGNGSTDGPFVYCGFRPKFVMVKRTDAAGANWYIHDTSRDTYNVSNKNLNPDLSGAENTTAYADMDIVSNGFKLRVGHAETNGSYNYIYAAFAENPLKYSNAR